MINIEKNKKIISVDAIDDCLPQTQCRQCDYAGCRPYAEAIVNDGERFDRCPPGGITTLFDLAGILQEDPQPFIAEMEKKSNPAMRAVIREDICIGCTKCIQACPVDAIIGAAKQMHTIIQDLCTGCELCLPPCPVDCIDLINLEKPSKEIQKNLARQSRQRYEKRQLRLARKKQQQHREHQIAKLNHRQHDTIEARKKAIRDAVLRVKVNKIKKSQHLDPGY